VRLFHLPRPRTPEGVPSLVEVAESPHVPWRWGLVRGLERPPSRLVVDDEPLLMGQAVARLPAQEWALWGLPEWRRPVGPQGFQDVRLEEVLGWVRGAWGKEDVLHELDGGTLYIGPLDGSPHASVRHRVAEEVAVLRRLAEGRYYLLLPPMPRLRLYHLLEVDHPGFRGVLRVVEHRLHLSGRDALHEVYGRAV
jgi:hypothetical protein